MGEIVVSEASSIDTPSSGNITYGAKSGKPYAKNSSGTEYDLTAGSDAITPDDFDAKGDILIGTGDGTFDALTVGADRKVLIADSTETSGMRWDCPCFGNNYKLVTKSANYTMDLLDDSTIITTNTAQITITMPDANGFANNSVAKEFGIYNLGSADVIVTLSGTNTFNDGTSNRTLESGDFIRFLGAYPSVGGGWVVVKEKNAYVQLRRSASWAASNFTSDTAVPFDTVDNVKDQYRLNGEVTTNPTRITMKKSGEFLLSAKGDINSTGGGSYSISGYLRVNGTDTINGSNFSFGNYQTEDTFFSLPSIIYKADADDYIELILDQNNLTGQAEDIIMTVREL